MVVLVVGVLGCVLVVVFFCIVLDVFSCYWYWLYSFCWILGRLFLVLRLGVWVLFLCVVFYKVFVFVLRCVWCVWCVGWWLVWVVGMCVWFLWWLGYWVGVGWVLCVYWLVVLDGRLWILGEVGCYLGYFLVFGCYWVLVVLLDVVFCFIVCVVGLCVGVGVVYWWYGCVWWLLVRFWDCLGCFVLVNVLVWLVRCFGLVFWYGWYCYWVVVLGVWLILVILFVRGFLDVVLVWVWVCVDYSMYVWFI